MSVMLAEDVMSMQRETLRPQTQKFVQKIMDGILEHVGSGSYMRQKRFDLNDVFGNDQLLAYVLEELEGLGYSCRLRRIGFDDNGNATGLEVVVGWGPVLDRFLP